MSYFSFRLELAVTEFERERLSTMGRSSGAVLQCRPSKKISWSLVPAGQVLDFLSSLTNADPGRLIEVGSERASAALQASFSSVACDSDLQISPGCLHGGSMHEHGQLILSTLLASSFLAPKLTALPL